MIRRVERYLIKVMKGERRGMFASLLRAVLLLLSWPYAFAVKLRNWGYDRGWFKQYYPPIPVVVSIGNIVAGGTGKTPALVMFAAEFYEKAIVGILSRGYRSHVEKLSVPVTVCAGKGPLHSAAYCGDEPFLLADTFPKAYVYAGKKRLRSANMAAKAGIELAILDDGMQHRQIGRDFEIIVMDVDDPLGHGHYLPRGFLRESPQSLSRADLIILNHVYDKEKFLESCALLRHYSKAPCVGTQPFLEAIYDLSGNKIENLEGKKAVLFCGIAQPDRFIELARQMGVQIIANEIFSDHASYCPEKLMKLAEIYKSLGAELMLCTQKDKVKIPELPGIAIPIMWVKISLHIVENQEEWEKFIGTIRLDLDNRTQRSRA